MVAVIASIVGLALAVLELIIQLTRFATKQEMILKEVRRDIAPIRYLPGLFARMSVVERHLNIEPIEIPLTNGKTHDGEA